MKFGKEFQSQMVPEWEEAYLSYPQLKLILKDIGAAKSSSSSSSSSAAAAAPPPPDNVADVKSSRLLKRKGSLYRAFSGLSHRHNQRSPSPAGGGSIKVDDEVILVSIKEDNDNTKFETLFLRPTEKGAEYELVFFRRLDHEFNKVVKFYKEKVDQVMKEADELSRQMNTLIALRIKVEKRDDDDDDDDDNNASTTLHSNNNITMDVIKEEDEEEAAAAFASKIDQTTTGQQQESSKKVQPPPPGGGGGGEDRLLAKHRPAPLELLQHVKINVEAETPISTIKGILGSTSTTNSFTKAELRTAHDKMTHAFISFHHKLRLLKSYCFLNQLAVSKIMKKYDKITLRNASDTYLKMVDKSYLNTSEEVNRLIGRVEAAFIKHFTNGNRKKGMRILRPTARRERHRVTFLLGSLFGFALALAITVVSAVHARNILEKPGPERDKYMENIFPLYSLFGFVVLHLIMYAIDIYWWRRYRINYPFIFGFKQGTELGYREVLLVAAGLAVLMLAGVVSNLDMEMDPDTGNYKEITELVPLILLIVVLLITFCPFNIMYRSSRFFLLRTTFRCICAPFYKVTLPDFFLADQFTSQLQALRNLEFYVCYYGWGDYKKRQNTCSSNQVYQFFHFVIAIIPFWMRYLQCLRRLHEEKDIHQGYNAIRYCTTVMALVLRSLYDLKGGNTWRLLAAICSGFSTVFNTYWDVIMDWGLLSGSTRNKFLRDKLAVPYNSVYYAAMVVNVVLRLAWTQSILDIEAPFLHKKAAVAVIASIEIIRRGMWNFFRIENEHLNNVGKFRAFKTVPLPFLHDDDM